jgi:retron-type reverse transcriptase
MTILGYYSGIKIIEDCHLTKEVLRKMCRSKKRRIIKKWKKNRKNYTTGPDTETMYRTPFGIVCHPILANMLKHKLFSIEVKT